MSARVLFVGLDAADPRLLDRFLGEGLLPSLAQLSEDGQILDLDNCLLTLAGGLWPEIWSGRSAGRSGLYFPYLQFRPGELEPRPTRMSEFDPRAFWTLAGEAGRRVAVVDVPLSIPAPGLNGIHLAQWGGHDRPYAKPRTPVSEPPELVREVGARYGVHPLWGNAWKQPPRGSACDGHNGTIADYERLLDDLCAGIELNAALLLDLLGRERWDLFACGLGEYQCVGHQFWRFQDSPAPPRLRDAIRDVFARLDATLGALLEAAGEDAAVLVLASHGHGPHTGGGQLLAEVLSRLGMGSRRGAAARSRRFVPEPLWSLARRLAPAGVRRAVHPPLLASPSTRAAAVSVDRTAWIRLNLKGRDPFGSVEPGAEAEALIEELREEFLALRQPESDEPIVLRVASAAEAYGANVHPDVPDLIVAFREDLGLIEACRSPRVGLVERPFPVPGHRSSSHPFLPSRLWAQARGSRFATKGNVLDIAPTILDLLGVSAPAWMDGRSLLVPGATNGSRDAAMW